jgi:hypothetical protein
MEGTVPQHRPDLGPCLQWTGSLKTKWGYGQLLYEGRNRSVHIAAWEIEHGPIPHGLTVDHLCRNTSCVRTSHMELVTAAENFRRAVAARTHCRNGHEYAAVGMYPLKNGRRRCKACTKRSVHNYERRKREAAKG